MWITKYLPTIYSCPDSSFDDKTFNKLGKLAEPVLDDFLIRYANYQLSCKTKQST